MQTQNWIAVAFGCIAAAALALVLDLLIRLMEVASARRSKPLSLTAAVGVLLVIAGGLAPVVIAGAKTDDRPTVVIGAKTFTEQYILASLIVDTLEHSGYRAERLQNLGSTVVFDALAAGKIDCYVDYTGTIWANHMHRNDQPGADVVMREVTEWLKSEHNIDCLGGLGFENAYALAMPRSVAAELDISTIADLVRHAPRMKIGGDYEFFARPEWQRLIDTYDLRFAETVTMDSTLMYSAAANGEVDVISAFSTDGRIAANDLIVLEDPQSAFPPYDAVLLLGPAAANDPIIREALEHLIGEIDDDAMRKANMLVDVEDRTINDASRALEAQLDRD